MARKVALSFLFVLYSVFSFSQVETEVDTTEIRIGEQINYKINVETDTTSLVVFPEGQTFLPLENVEALEVDTTKKESKFLLSRIYKLTQFDSGAYTIPRQKVIIGDKSFFTDSLRIDVNTIEVDTTKQKLYDIKPIIEVEKSGGNWWKWLLGILAAIALVAFLLWWFIWRQKPLTEEEEIALLPAYDRAKIALQKLDESQYLMRSEVKEYYSELTFIIRKYLDEKVYDKALESTTDQLITRLDLLREGNQIKLSKDTISNIESILKRADLVKFAKSAPDIALAEMDKATIAKEVDQVKASLPEPTEEEKLLDQQYREEQERKKKRRKIILTVAISLFLIIATFVGFGLKYGFEYVKDTIIGHESKELLESDWVESAYGYPPVWIETPKVLQRYEPEIPEHLKDSIDMTVFQYASVMNWFYINISTTNKLNKEDDLGFEQAPEAAIKKLEESGAQDIFVKRDQFITPNGADGVKTHGTMKFSVLGSEELIDGEYAIFHFIAEEVMQQIIIKWKADDDYADKIVERVINSMEVLPDELPEEDEE